MKSLIERLNPKGRRGSKPRCHILTHGPQDRVANVLSALASPFASVSVDDCWMPVGFDEVLEAELNKAPRLLSTEVRAQLGSWWLPADRQSATTPNFDISSTCKVGGVPGLLLVEAKAHVQELTKEEAGRALGTDAFVHRKASHGTIGHAIAEAADGLALAMSARCRISRDAHYQMSNRFAWAWKLTQLDVPVVLVYLGFLGAEEMADISAPFAESSDWLQRVKSHGAALFEMDPWERTWVCNG